MNQYWIKTDSWRFIQIWPQVFSIFVCKTRQSFLYDNLTSFFQIGTKYAIRLTLWIGHDATSFAVLGSINMFCSATFKEDLATITLCNKFWLCVYFVCAVTVWFLYHNRSHSFLYIPVGTWMWLLYREILSKKGQI